MATTAADQDGPNTQNMVNPRAAVAEGLAITWLQHRGPGSVTFEPMMPPLVNGSAVAMAHFSEPGTYTLRAVADDTVLTTVADVTITVNPPSR